MTNVRKNIKNKALTGAVRYAPKRVLDLTKDIVPKIRKQTKNINKRLKKRSDKGGKRVNKAIKKAILGVPTGRRKRR